MEDFSKFKLLVLDVDGTAIPDGESLPRPILKDTLQNLSKKMPISFCTGRSYDEILPILEYLDLPKSYHILGGGGVLLTKAGTFEDLARIETSTVQKLIAKATQYKLGMNFLVGGAWRAAPPRESESAASVFFACDSHSDALALSEELKDLNDQLSIGVATASDMPGVGLVHFTPRNLNKGSGLKKLCEFYDIKCKDAICAGDMTNDLPMFELAGFSIALGNAPNIVKKKASYIAQDVAQDGLALALQELMLDKGV